MFLTNKRLLMRKLSVLKREAKGMDMKEDPLIKFLNTFDEDTITITDRVEPITRRIKIQKFLN